MNTCMDHRFHNPTWTLKCWVVSCSIIHPQGLFLTCLASLFLAELESGNRISTYSYSSPHLFLTPESLNLHTVDILGWIIVYCRGWGLGGVLCIVGCWVVSRTSTHQMPVTPLSQADNQKYLQELTNVSLHEWWVEVGRKQDYPPLGEPLLSTPWGPRHWESYQNCPALTRFGSERSLRPINLPSQSTQPWLHLGITQDIANDHPGIFFKSFLEDLSL